MREVSSHQSEVDAVERERSRIVLTSVFALAFLTAAFVLLGPPPSAIVIVAIVVLISFKKAAVRYRWLGRKRDELR